MSLFQQMTVKGSERQDKYLNLEIKLTKTEKQKVNSSTHHH